MDCMISVSFLFAGALYGALILSASLLYCAVPMVSRGQYQNAYFANARQLCFAAVNLKTIASVAVLELLNEMLLGVCHFISTT